MKTGVGKFRVLRGERLLQALIDEEVTYQQLRTNIERGFPDTRKRQHATNEVNVANTQFVPAANSLQVNCVSRSNGHTYQQTILFSGVAYQKEDTPENITFMGTDGAEHHVQPIVLQDNRVKVRCSCLDFHYRFASWNFNDGALMGENPPLYQRKTDTRPPANPLQVSGVCKHLIKLVDNLKRIGLIR